MLTRVPPVRQPAVALPPDLYERLAAAAREHDRAIAAELRVALRAYLDMLERRRAAAA